MPENRRKRAQLAKLVIDIASGEGENKKPTILYPNKAKRLREMDDIVGVLEAWENSAK
jgi:hypothetical protein